MSTELTFPLPVQPSHRERLEKEGLTADLVFSDMAQLPFADGSFDACISRGVITHNTLPNIEQTLTEVHRTLRPRGLLMCTFVSTESSLYGQSEEIEPNRFIGGDPIKEGVPHNFMGRDEILAATAGFGLLSLDHMKHGGLVDTGVPYVSAHWVFVGEKLH